MDGTSTNEMDDRAREKGEISAAGYTARCVVQFQWMLATIPLARH